MDSRAAHLDPEVFSRTSALFQTKRRVLPPHVVEGFARQIVARMASAPSLRERIDERGIEAEHVAAFCDLLLQPAQEEATLAFIRARRAEGVSRRGVFLGYVTEAARLLGARFDSEELTPLDVTIAAGNLYALMRALQSGPRPGFVHRRTALFATVPGEAHGIGITVAANIFRDAGWDIDLQLGLDEGELIERVERMQPWALGLSLSTQERLPDLLHLVMTLRILVPGIVIGVAAGGELGAADLQGVADVDLLFCDAATALADLEHLAQARD